MTISIIIPLLDRRNAGWRSLESALDQDFDRERYEVVAVLGAGTNIDMVGRQLLQRCDKVVRVEADPDRARSEIFFYMAGYAEATGDVLFFAEGHTELKKNCCSAIEEYFAVHPQAAVAWAPRINYQASTLGALIGLVNSQTEALAEKQGAFTLGANSVIKRSLFEQLGGLEPQYFRLNENVLFERMRQRGIAIGKISAPLAVHFNDVSRSFLIELVVVAGKAKFNWCETERKSAIVNGPAQVKYAVYCRLAHKSTAWIVSPVCRLLGRCCLVLATALCAVNKAVAGRLYVTALRFYSAVGFCMARNPRGRKTEAPGFAPGA